jgi:hypothetical protein
MFLGVLSSFNVQFQSSQMNNPGLNLLNLTFSSFQYSNPLLPKETLDGGFTIMSSIRFDMIKSEHVHVCACMSMI